MLECALVFYTSGLLAGWQMPVVFHAEEARVLVFLIHLPGHLWPGRRWDHLDDDVGGDRADTFCRGYFSVPGSTDCLFREPAGVHLGVDSLGFVGHVGRLLDGNWGFCAAELV